MILRHEEQLLMSTRSFKNFATTNDPFQCQYTVLKYRVFYRLFDNVSYERRRDHAIFSWFTRLVRWSNDISTQRFNSCWKEKKTEKTLSRILRTRRNEAAEKRPECVRPFITIQIHATKINPKRLHCVLKMNSLQNYFSSLSFTPPFYSLSISL